MCVWGILEANICEKTSWILIGDYMMGRIHVVLFWLESYWNCFGVKIKIKSGFYKMLLKQIKQFTT